MSLPTVMTRQPKFYFAPCGDIATVLDIYDNPPGYELECSDEHGITQWQLAFRIEDIDLEPVI